MINFCPGVNDGAWPIDQDLKDQLPDDFPCPGQHQDLDSFFQVAAWHFCHLVFVIVSDVMGLLKRPVQSESWLVPFLNCNYLNKRPG